jgi:hypothetical protein
MMWNAPRHLYEKLGQRLTVAVPYCHRPIYMSHRHFPATNLIPLRWGYILAVELWLMRLFMRGFHGERRLIEYPFVVTPNPTKTDGRWCTYIYTHVSSIYMLHGPELFLLIGVMIYPVGSLLHLVHPKLLNLCRVLMRWSYHARARNSKRQRL